MKKNFLVFLFLPLFVSKASLSVIKSEVNAEEGTSRTEITIQVNGQTTKIESDQPGKIEVEAKNGEVEIKASPSGAVRVEKFGQEPSESEMDSEAELNQEPELDQEEKEEVESLKLKISSLVKEIWLKVKDFLGLKLDN